MEEGSMNEATIITMVAFIFLYNYFSAKEKDEYDELD
jgi:hypothetical protein